jgi:hypothetical protein
VSSSDSYRVPPRLRGRFDEIVARTDAIAARYLDAEYAELCRRMAAALARKRPSPLEAGEARPWSAGIVYAVGWVNFLADPAQRPHMTTAALAAAIGVGQSTIAATFKRIRSALDLSRLDPAWTRPSKLIDNPLAWMLLVDGIPVDARHAPREFQEEAFRQGLIPFVPARRTHDSWPVADDGGNGYPPPPMSDAESGFQDVIAEAEALVEKTLADHPDVTIEDLDALLATAVAGYNDRPQAELGGLSPTDVQRLLDAEWEGPESAVHLDDTLSLVELEPSAALHDARLVLDMLAEQGAAKATPKGNLSRAFVREFRERMRPRATPWNDWLTEAQVPKEEDVRPLHLARVLLELAGFLKRRKGTFSRTKRGDALSTPERAGALFATLVRVHFRQLNLSYLDGAPPAPAFQHTIAYTLHQFGRACRRRMAEARRADGCAGAPRRP